MIILIKELRVRQFMRTAPDGLMAVILVPMNRSVNRVVAIFAPSNHLHDVRFAAFRPTDGGDVVTQHPERRPNALAVGQPNAGGDFPKLPGMFALRLHATGSVSAVGLLDG